MLQAMNTGHDGSLSTVHANCAARRARPHRDDGADGRLRPAGPGDPPAGVVGARPDRPSRAPGGRLAPRHRDHRGAADGVRRHHAAGPLRVQGRARSRRIGPSSGACGRPGLRPSSCTSSRSAASRCRPPSSAAAFEAWTCRAWRLDETCSSAAPPVALVALVAASAAAARRRARRVTRGGDGRSFPERAFVLTLPSVRLIGAADVACRERRAGLELSVTRRWSRGKPRGLRPRRSTRARAWRGAPIARRWPRPAFAAQRKPNQSLGRHRVQRRRRDAAPVHRRRGEDRRGARASSRRLAYGTRITRRCVAAIALTALGANLGPLDRPALGRRRTRGASRRRRRRSQRRGATGFGLHSRPALAVLPRADAQERWRPARAAGTRAVIPEALTGIFAQLGSPLANEYLLTLPVARRPERARGVAVSVARTTWDGAPAAT